MNHSYFEIMFGKTCCQNLLVNKEVIAYEVPLGPHSMVAGQIIRMMDLWI